MSYCKVHIVKSVITIVSKYNRNPKSSHHLFLWKLITFILFQLLYTTKTLPNFPSPIFLDAWCHLFEVNWKKSIALADWVACHYWLIIRDVCLYYSATLLSFRRDGFRFGRVNKKLNLLFYIFIRQNIIPSKKKLLECLRV